MRPALLVLLAFGCGNTQPPATPGPMRPAGLYAEPARLAYTCVTPGCDEKITTRITVSGDRRVAIKRILLEGTASSDFTFTTTEKAPFIVGSASSFNVEVQYAPKGAPLAGIAQLRLTFTDASAEESPLRLEPGDLYVPLVRRLVGEPVLTVTPPRLSFGVVEKDATKTLPLRVSNTGFGNVVLELSGIDAGAAPLTAKLPMLRSLAADAGVDVPVTWSPTEESFLSALMEVRVASPGVQPALVRVEGTSLTQPVMAVEPAAAIDFGEVARGASRLIQVQVLNQGGLGLRIDYVGSNDTTGNLKAGFDGGVPQSLAPLGRVPLNLDVKGVTAGEVAATVSFLTNAPGSGATSISVKGTITEPRVTPSPAMIDFGAVPMGWVVRKSIELKNTGYGTLTVKNLGFVAGSSTVFTLVGKPALPLTIKREQRVAFDVELTAASQSTFGGFVSIETDDPITPFAEVPLTAKIGSCAAGCPIANGVPSCTTGSCKVGSCNAGFFDTDLAAANGCECKEVGTDPGEFCADATYLGTLNDGDGDQASFTGIIPTRGDIDVLRFFGEDGSQLFSEKFKVKVRLASSDPGIGMCVYRADSATHQSDCFFTNEVCPASNYYEKGGSWGSEDGADFIVKVTRLASTTASATCTPYTVFMSNGR